MSHVYLYTYTYSHPARQSLSLFEYKDCIGGDNFKAEVAAARMRRFSPACAR